MIFLVPEFFFYKWELHKGNYELLIDIPENISEIIKSDLLTPPSQPSSQSSFNGFIPQ